MEENSSITASYMFRGVEYVLTMNIIGGNVLEVEVEDRMTADQWKGTFDTTYIEDLTNKTGNFKQFNIFVNMLESALTEASDSVSLDLLTYSDLESLRQRKQGTGPRPVVQPKSSAINTKRYLILTYTVEFDRIHYPLPLPYIGKPDPRLLQETIRELRERIKGLKHKGSPGRTTDQDYMRLKKEYEALLDEKEELEVEFLQMKKEIQESNFKGPASKEIKILKTVVKNLEDDLLKEKNKHQKLSSKRNEEYRDLMNEVEELRANERNLRVRVKSLTNELNIYKRSRRSPGIPNSQSSVTRGRAITRRSASRERSLSRDRDMSRDRSLSRDRFGSQEQRRTSSGTSFRARTPSPSPITASGTRNPRFDPTSFVKEKERRKHEAELKQRRIKRPGVPHGGVKHLRSSPLYRQDQHSEKGRFFTGRVRTRSRTSSVGSVGSQGSVGQRDDSTTRLRNINKVLKRDKTSSANSWNSPNVPLRNRTHSGGRQRSRLVIDTPDSGDRVPVKKRTRQNKENYERVVDSDYFDRSVEISDIDARLNRLQQFMRTNMSK